MTLSVVFDLSRGRRALPGLESSKIRFCLAGCMLTLLSFCGESPEHANANSQSGHSESHAEEGTHDHGAPEESDSQHSEESSSNHTHNETDSSGSNQNAGPQYAVLKANQEKGIQLSEQSLKICGIRFAAPGKYKGNFPASSLVHVSGLQLVYVRNGDWIFPVNLGNSTHSQSAEEIPSLRKAAAVDWDQSELAVENVDIIHLALLEAFGASGSGHGH
ncbi:MAG: hypothetical protein RH862_20570 [Leptospiraceae bacterium]